MLRTTKTVHLEGNVPPGRRPSSEATRKTEPLDQIVDERHAAALRDVLVEVERLGVGRRRGQRGEGGERPTTEHPRRVERRAARGRSGALDASRRPARTYATRRVATSRRRRARLKKLETARLRQRDSAPHGIAAAAREQQPLAPTRRTRSARRDEAKGQPPLHHRRRSAAARRRRAVGPPAHVFNRTARGRQRRQTGHPAALRGGGVRRLRARRANGPEPLRRARRVPARLANRRARGAGREAGRFCKRADGRGRAESAPRRRTRRARRPGGIRRSFATAFDGRGSSRRCDDPDAARPRAAHGRELAQAAAAFALVRAAEAVDGRTYECVVRLRTATGSGGPKGCLRDTLASLWRRRGVAAASLRRRCGVVAVGVAASRRRRRGGAAASSRWASRRHRARHGTWRLPEHPSKRRRRPAQATTASGSARRIRCSAFWGSRRARAPGTWRWPRCRGTIFL